eukprot:Rhum_TRINITY_DN13194_c2_g1::Rhum_TRINITY_DN13194_c2_g1_i1::g.57792::m.57792
MTAVVSPSQQSVNKHVSFPARQKEIKKASAQFGNKIDYIRRHNVVQMFEDMVKVLIEERPDHPLRFLIEHASGKPHHVRQGGSHKEERLQPARGMSLDGRKFTLCDPGLTPQVFARAGSVFDVGEDPLLAPDGIYGEFGATHARRSIALGLATTASDKRQGDGSGGGGGGGGG